MDEEKSSYRAYNDDINGDDPAQELERPEGAPWRRRSITKEKAWILKFVILLGLFYWIFKPHNTIVCRWPRRYSHRSPVEILYSYLSEVDIASRYMLCCNGLFASYGRLLLQQGDLLHSPRDPWGNVKIPDISSLNSSTADKNGWIPIPKTDNLTYSSLMGVPISKIPSAGTTTFSIEYSHYKVQCSNVTMGGLRDFWIVPIGHAIWEYPLYNGPFNQTNITFGFDTWNSLAISTSGLQNLRWPQRWTQLSNPNATDLEYPYTAQPLIVQSTYYGSSIKYVRDHPPNSPWQTPNVMAAFCTIQTSYIEASISCHGNSKLCITTSIRPSLIPHPTLNATDLQNIRALYEFSRDFLIAGRDGHADIEGALIDGNTLTEYFLQYPYFGNTEWGNYGPFYRHELPSPQQMGVRVQQVLNSFKMLSMGGTTFEISPAFNSSRVARGENVVEG